MWYMWNLAKHRWILANFIANYVGARIAIALQSIPIIQHPGFLETSRDLCEVAIGMQPSSVSMPPLMFLPRVLESA